MGRVAAESSSRMVETVYVVDDDSSMRTALDRLFRTTSFAVKTFDSAEAFLAHESDTVPCCVVLDLRMPGLDGIAMQARLREAGRMLPVVFITGHGDVPTSVRAMKTGAIDFIEKPFESDELIAAVRRALSASQSMAHDREQRAILEQKLKSLTPREREVFLLVTQGLLNKVVAGRLGTAEKTIKVHRGRVMEKMAARSLADLVRIAERLDLVK
jgi:FixJ family two-component response regulator